MQCKPTSGPVGLLILDGRPLAKTPYPFMKALEGSTYLSTEQVINHPIGYFSRSAACMLWILPPPHVETAFLPPVVWWLLSRACKHAQRTHAHGHTCAGTLAPSSRARTRTLVMHTCRATHARTRTHTHTNDKCKLWHRRSHAIPLASHAVQAKPTTSETIPWQGGRGARTHNPDSYKQIPTEQRP